MPTNGRHRDRGPAHLDAQAQTLARLYTGLWHVEVAVVVLGVCMLAISGLVGYQLLHPPEMGYVRALGAVDVTLMQTWNTLPKATQEQLSATYQRLGWASPGQRSK